MWLTGDELLLNTRFDIPAKHLYARYRASKYDTFYGHWIYSQHLAHWNGFKEYDDPTKSSEAAFIERYDELLDDVRDNGFDKERSSVPITEYRQPLNGSHRIAACLFHNKPIWSSIEDDSAGQRDCSSYFFRRKGMPEEVLDAMALEYCRLRDKTRIVTLFPTATTNAETAMKVRDILSKHGMLIHEKGIGGHLGTNFAHNLMIQTYDGEDWIGDPSNSYAGAMQKAQLCFRDIDAPTVAFMVEFDDDESSRKAKEEIRELFGVGNHSVHINDTFEETMKLARLFFNKNSLIFCFYGKVENFENFRGMLDEYQSGIGDGNEDFCVTASSVLSMFGIREGRDLDFLHNADVDSDFDNPLLSSHNKELEDYTTNLDNILYNPMNHFWWNNIKFAGPNVIIEMKEKRGEEKDIRDVTSLREVLETVDNDTGK